MLVPLWSTSLILTNTSRPGVTWHLPHPPGVCACVRVFKFVFYVHCSVLTCCFVSYTVCLFLYMWIMDFNVNTIHYSPPPASYLYTHCVWVHITVCKSLLTLCSVAMFLIQPLLRGCCERRSNWNSITVPTERDKWLCVWLERPRTIDGFLQREGHM